MVFSHSEPWGRRSNEDVCDVRPHPADASCWLCALADGQGGHAGSAAAAQRACRAAIEAAAVLPVPALMLSPTWVSILRRADAAVSADPQAGFTTLAGFAVVGRTIVGASSGDSAVCLVSEGRLRDLTAHQVKNPPVGSGAAVIVPFAAALPPGWLILAMSDGVWKYVGLEGVRELAACHRGGELLGALRQRAGLPGSGKLQDDFTVLTLEESV
jgi:hypothetical protein